MGRAAAEEEEEEEEEDSEVGGVVWGGINVSFAGFTKEPSVSMTRFVVPKGSPPGDKTPPPALRTDERAACREDIPELFSSWTQTPSTVSPNFV